MVDLQQVERNQLKLIKAAVYVVGALLPLSGRMLAVHAS